MAEDSSPPFQDDVKEQWFRGIDRKRLFIRDQADPLLSSPLSFQTKFTSHDAQAHRSPIGRPLVQHAPTDYHYSKGHHRRFLPQFDAPLLGFGNLSLSRPQARQHSEGPSPRRRSLPPDFGSPVSTAQHSKTPSLWSVHEELSFHEPMDISPDKALRSSNKSSTSADERSISPLALRRQGPAVSLTGFRRLNSEEVEKSNRDDRLKSLKNNYIETKQEPVRVEKKKKRGKSEVDGDRPGGRGWISWCCIMILELIAGAGAVVASMFGVDMFGFWCQHYKGLNTTSLSQTLNDHVFGQHVAIETIPNVMTEYLHQSALGSQQPLVLSFHGWTGIGKNHVSFLISEQLRRGQAHKIISTLHFPHRNIDYTEALESMIFPKLYSCRLNLFLIDEIDKAPPNVIKALLNILTRMRSRDFLKMNYRVVFLLLSNTGASQINHHVFETIQMGSDLREVITHDALVNVLLEAQYQNPEDFDWFTQLHNEGLIDVIIPFLPLERKHVEKCAMADMQSKGIYASDAMIQKIVNEMSFVPADEPVFSASGCRKVPTKVDITRN